MEACVPATGWWSPADAFFAALTHATAKCRVVIITVRHVDISAEVSAACSPLWRDISFHASRARSPLHGHNPGASVMVWRACSSFRQASSSKYSAAPHTTTSCCGGDGRRCTMTLINVNRGKDHWKDAGAGPCTRGTQTCHRRQHGSRGRRRGVHEILTKRLTCLSPRREHLSDNTPETRFDTRFLASSGGCKSSIFAGVFKKGSLFGFSPLPGSPDKKKKKTINVMIKKYSYG